MQELMVRIFDKAQKIKDLWDFLYENSNAPSTMSYEMALIFEKSFYLYFRRWGYCHRYVVIEEGTSVAIMPISVDKKHRKIEELYCMSTVPYYDIVTNDESCHFISGVIPFLKKTFAGYNIHFSKMGKESVLARHFLKDGVELSQDVCVSIKIGNEGYDSYFSNLSKHQRQNIRTAYNKLDKNHIEYKIQRFQDIPHGLWLQCLRMYEKRSIRHWGGMNSKWSKFIISFSLLRNRYCNPINHILRRFSESEFFVLYFNEEPVAYMAGFYSKDKRTFIVPRLSTSELWLPFSPGIILLCESIKHLIGLNVTTLDLAHGAEGYKYAMGGIDCNTYSVIL